MKLHLEILNHFSCDNCGYWWSIASVRLELGSKVYCPWCGHQNIVSEIDDKGNVNSFDDVLRGQQEEGVGG